MILIKGIILFLFVDIVGNKVTSAEDVQALALYLIRQNNNKLALSKYVNNENISNFSSNESTLSEESSHTEVNPTNSSS